MTGAPGDDDARARASPGAGARADLKGRAIRAMAWTGLSYGSRFFAQIAIGAILARLLTPEDFGLVAMSALVINFLLLFRGAGLSDALQQRDTVRPGHLNAVFWYTLGMGTAIAGLVAVTASAIAWLYDEPRLTPIVALSGLTVLVNSLSSTHTGILARGMRFKALAAREVSSQLVAGIAAIVLAWQGFGVYSLVLQGILAGLFNSAFLWVAVRWRPTFSFQWSDLKELLGFGANVTGFQVVNYVFRNLDALLVGRFLSATTLGFYQQAYRAVRLPTQMLQDVVSRVMFPALSRLRDLARFRTSYRDAIHLLAAALYFPITAMLVLAAPLVHVLYGGQWDRSIPLVRLFAGAGYVQIVWATFGWIFKGVGRPNLQFRLALLLQPVTVTFVVVGLQWGVQGVALAYLASNYVLLPAWPYCFRLIGLHTSKLVQVLVGPGLAAAVAATAMALVLLAFERLDLTSDLAALAVGGLVGGLAYLATLAVVDREVLQEARDTLRHLRAPTGPVEAAP